MSKILPTLDQGRGNNGWTADIWKPTAAPLVWYFQNKFRCSFLKLWIIGNFNWSPCISMSNNAKCQWMAFLFKTCFKLGGKCHGASLKLVAYEYVLWLGHRSAYWISLPQYLSSLARTHSTYLPSDERTLAGNGWGSRESEEHNQIPELE